MIGAFRVFDDVVGEDDVHFANQLFKVHQPFDVGNLAREKGVVFGQEVFRAGHTFFGQLVVVADAPQAGHVGGKRFNRNRGQVLRRVAAEVGIGGQLFRVRGRFVAHKGDYDVARLDSFVFKIGAGERFIFWFVAEVEDARPAVEFFQWKLIGAFRVFDDVVGGVVVRPDVVE